MNTAEPIRNKDELQRFRDYFLYEKPHARNHVLLCIGLNTALRISDILALRWCDVYDFSKEKFHQHIQIMEQKTGKRSCIYANQSVLDSLGRYKASLEEQGPLEGSRYLFEGDSAQPISRVQAWRIIKTAAEQCQLSGVISPHSLRKTFGYQAWQQGISPALLMDIYNHSSFTTTKRYLGIAQDDRDEVFRNICI